MRAIYGRQNDLPKDTHALIPETCKYVMLHGKGDFSDAIKITDLQIGRLPWIIQVSTT